MTDEIAVVRGSGNVFADLGFDNPEEELFKAQLVREIRDLLKRRRLTQAKAAELLGLKQPDVSALVNGRVHKFSLERLLRCIRRLDREVTIVTRPRRGARAADLGGGVSMPAASQPPSFRFRCASVRNRSALSLMKPAASRWS